MNAKPTKVRRSRNGCKECRRLHRRCDEARPSCEACLKEGKQCFYHRDFAWVEGPTKRCRPSRRDGTTLSPAAVKYRQHGQVHSKHPDSSLQLKSSPGLELSGYRMRDWLPWLSSRHRMLFAHFANVTCATFFLNADHHRNLCSTLIPLAVDAYSSFPLISAILCVASTHLKSLDVEVDDREAAHWEAMAAGHLGRQAIARDRASESTFAATALLLSHRDIFAGGERAGSWRVHLEGALTILDRPTEQEDLANSHLRSVGATMRWVASVFRATSRKMSMSTGHHCSSRSHLSTCDVFDEFLGVSRAVVHILVDIENIADDMTALTSIERASNQGEQGMGPLWQALSKRVESIVHEGEVMKEDLQNMLLQSVAPADGSTCLTEAEELALMNQAYYHITMSQIQLRLLGCDPDHDSVQENLALAMDCLQRIELRDYSSPGMALVQPTFIVGCFALKNELRQRTITLLSESKRKHGRQNAERARQFLLEFWQRKDADVERPSAERLDVRLALGVPHRRSNDYEWTDFMAHKGWDLSLW